MVNPDAALPRTRYDLTGRVGRAQPRLRSLCVANDLVPITESQGIWQLPPGSFQSNFCGA